MITTLTVNYNTPDFLSRLVLSFRQFYDLPMLIVDGSSDSNYASIRHLLEYDVTIHHHDHNIHHGPGLAYGFRTIQTDQILILDSDLIVLNPGFVEDLQSKLSPDAYGIGDVQEVDSRGRNIKHGFRTRHGIKYLHPACALINRHIALQYPMPIKHGAPMIETMKEIDRQKLSSKLLQCESWVTNDFRNNEKIYICHDWQGTVKRTGGYHL
ncbi:MAG: glycosyltransferase family A protein [Candidatus Krumholzibacteriia bacterium]